MPKLKTHRGAAKRFKLTSSGKIKRKKACARHLLTKKDRDRKRSSRIACLVSQADSKRIKRALGK